MLACYFYEASTQHSISESYLSEIDKDVCTTSIVRFCIACPFNAVEIEQNEEHALISPDLESIVGEKSVRVIDNLVIDNNMELLHRLLNWTDYI